MSFNHVVVFAAIVFCVVHSQTPTPTTPAPSTQAPSIDSSIGCLDGSEKEIRGSYTQIEQSCSDYPIWVQQVDSGESYTVFWIDAGTDYNYPIWGFYRCDTSNTYEEWLTSEGMNCPKPNEIMGCSAYSVHCPCIADEDANMMSDGMGLDGTDITLVDKPEFYDCTKWFTMEDMSTTNVNFEVGGLCDVDTDTDTDNTRNPITGGDVGSGGSLSNTTGMSSAGVATLITVMAIFAAFALFAALFFYYRQKQKEAEQSGKNVGLTSDNIDNEQLESNPPTSILQEDGPKIEENQTNV